MTEPKTRPTGIPAADFVNAIPDAQVRQDCWTIIEIMQEAAQDGPRMWGASIVGFGRYRLIDSRGRGSDWPLIGFSPRKQALTLYLMLNGVENAEELLARLGKHTRSKGCIYIKRLADVDLIALQELVQTSFDAVVRAYPAAGGAS